MNALLMTRIKIFPPYLLAGQMLPRHHLDTLITESPSNYGCFYLSFYFPLPHLKGSLRFLCIMPLVWYTASPPRCLRWRCAQYMKFSQCLLKEEKDSFQQSLGPCFSHRDTHGSLVSRDIVKVWYDKKSQVLVV